MFSMLPSVPTGTARSASTTASADFPRAWSAARFMATVLVPMPPLPPPPTVTRRLGGAKLERANCRLEPVEHGEHDDRGVGPGRALANPLAHPEAVDLGHHQVD